MDEKLNDVNKIEGRFLFTTCEVKIVCNPDDAVIVDENKDDLNDIDQKLKNLHVSKEPVKCKLAREYELIEQLSDLIT